MPSSAMRHLLILAFALLWILSLQAAADSSQATSSAKGAG